MACRDISVKRGGDARRRSCQVRRIRSLSLRDCARTSASCTMAASGTAQEIEGMHQIIVGASRSTWFVWQQRGEQILHLLMLQGEDCWRLGFLAARMTACYSVRFLRLVRKKAACFPLARKVLLSMGKYCDKDCSFIWAR